MRSKVALYFLVGSMAVTRCSFFSPVEHGEIEAEGIIEVLEVSAWMYGTHILLNDDGIIMYALRSSEIDLDYYVAKRTKIEGNLVPGYPVDGGPLYLDVVYAWTGGDL